MFISGLLLLGQAHCKRVCPTEPAYCRLQAISWSLILICHSAALNTCRQIPADTRGWGDRKQLGGFFPWKSVNDSKRPKRKTLGAQTTPAGRKKKNLGFLVTLKELLCFGSLTIWGVFLPKFATYENPNGPIYSSSLCLRCKESEIMHLPSWEDFHWGQAPFFWLNTHPLYAA